MYLQLLNYVSYFFNGLFMLLIFRTFALPYLKHYWQKHNDKKAEAAYTKREQELLAEGNKEFHFENGKVRVFAKTPEQAKFQYREMKRQLKTAK